MNKYIVASCISAIAQVFSWNTCYIKIDVGSIANSMRAEFAKFEEDNRRLLQSGMSSHEKHEQISVNVDEFKRLHDEYNERVNAIIKDIELGNRIGCCIPFVLLLLVIASIFSNIQILPEIAIGFMIFVEIGSIYYCSKNKYYVI